MSTFPLHTIESAPEASKPALRDLEQTFGFVPNVAAAMAESSTLLRAFVPVFQQVHSGSFTKAEIQVVLLTNAVTNAAAWPVALHSKLALDAGVSAKDVEAIRSRRAPADARLAALSTLARRMIEERGHVATREVGAAGEAGYRADQLLELITIVAASTMTNYVCSLVQPPLEVALEPHAWRG